MHTLAGQPLGLDLKLPPLTAHCPADLIDTSAFASFEGFLREVQAAWDRQWALTDTADLAGGGWGSRAVVLEGLCGARRQVPQRRVACRRWGLAAAGLAGGSPWVLERLLGSGVVFLSSSTAPLFPPWRLPARCPAAHHWTAGQSPLDPAQIDVALPIRLLQVAPPVLHMVASHLSHTHIPKLAGLPPLEQFR